MVISLEESGSGSGFSSWRTIVRIMAPQENKMVQVVPTSSSVSVPAALCWLLLGYGVSMLVCAPSPSQSGFLPPATQNTASLTLFLLGLSGS